MFPKRKSVTVLKTTKDGLKIVYKGHTATRHSFVYQERKERRLKRSVSFIPPEWPACFERYKTETWLRKHKERYLRTMRQVEKRFEQKRLNRGPIPNG